MGSVVFSRRGEGFKGVGSPLERKRGLKQTKPKGASWGAARGRLWDDKEGRNNLRRKRWGESLGFRGKKGAGLFWLMSGGTGGGLTESLGVHQVRTYGGVEEGGEDARDSER